jgi:hypothetical protein
MIRMILLLFMTLVPAAVFAQQIAPSIDVDASRSHATEDRGIAAAPAQSATTQPPIGPFPARRRYSMVGYVEDAVIESKVRIRFDTGLHTTAPDRAEFFYAKCGCYSGLDVHDPGYDPDAPGPQPGIATDLNFQQLNVWGEYALSSRFSVFGQFPLRWIQPQAFLPGTEPGFTNQGGLSDLRAGAKAGLAASPDMALTAQVQFYFPSGDAGKGLGTNHAGIEPTLIYYQRANRVSVESQFGLFMPFGGSAGVPIDVDENFSGNVLYYGVGPSFELYSGDRVQFAPVVELVGWHVLGGFNTTSVVTNNDGAMGKAEGTNILNLKIGARTAFGTGSIYVGYGHGLTDATWYDDIVRFEYRFTF